MSISIRTDIPDAHAYFQLYQTTGWNSDERWTKEMLDMAIHNSWYIVTGYHEDKLVASGRLISDGILQCFLCDMIIHPDYQHQGIGRVIISHLIQHCIDNKIRWIQLACAQGKKGFYEQFGFQERALDAPGMSLFLN